VRVEHAEISLLGGREDNQDRVSAVVAGESALLVVVDGMGGHAHGAKAAEVTRKSVVDAFAAAAQPIFDPLGFLHLALGRAHEEVVRIGESLAMEQRPRATCAVCLVQTGSAWWAHIGDSRIYLLRGGAIATRTRDHSHVELLLREGLITPELAQNHPMRNYVECCVGGDDIMPDMTLSSRIPLRPNDVLLVCSDGFWASLSEVAIAGALCTLTLPIAETLMALGQRAIKNAGMASDNTSAVALRWFPS
jgi:serine/threonine protein phosphatase PrpC